MIKKIQINHDEIENYWKFHKAHMAEAMIKDNKKVDQQAIDSLSQQARQRLEVLSKDDHVTVVMLYFYKNRKHIGCCHYIYNSQKEEIYLVDFWIFKPFRNQFLGKACFSMIYLEHLEAKYITTDATDLENQRFWQQLGFTQSNQSNAHYGRFIKFVDDKIPALSQTYNMNLDPQPFKMIKSGEKTIELRLNDQKRKSMMIGDVIIFNEQSSHHFVVTVIKNKYVFKDFESLYETLPHTACGYDKKTMKQAHPSDMQAYYKKQQIDTHGVLGIEIKHLKKFDV